MWERWYEALLEEEKPLDSKDVTVQCVDFCEAVTSKVHAVLQHAPFDLRRGTFLQHPRVLVAAVEYQEKPHLCVQILHAAMFPGLSRCKHTTPIPGRYGESGDSVASGRDPTAAECVCPEWSRKKMKISQKTQQHTMSRKMKQNSTIGAKRKLS